MDHADYLAAIARESAALEAVVRSAPLDTQVPSCPEWDLAELARHCGGAHAWGRATVASGSMEPLSRGEWMQRPETDAEVPDWFAAGAAELGRVCTEAGPDRPVWTWGPPPTSAFWARRMTHETAVHRWDAQGAVGDPDPIERELAVDGIDEYLVLAPVLRGERLRGSGELLRLACTDADAAWSIRLTPDGIHTERVAPDDATRDAGDALVRGTASDVELLFVGRTPGDSIEITGDEALVTRWQQLAAF
jgi:uncharacterized protein (TIGR03083 family)